MVVLPVGELIWEQVSGFSLGILASLIAYFAFPIVNRLYIKCRVSLKVVDSHLGRARLVVTNRSAQTLQNTEIAITLDATAEDCLPQEQTVFWSVDDVKLILQPTISRQQFVPIQDMSLAWSRMDAGRNPSKIDVYGGSSRDFAPFQTVFAAQNIGQGRQQFIVIGSENGWLQQSDAGRPRPASVRVILQKRIYKGTLTLSCDNMPAKEFNVEIDIEDPKLIRISP